MKIVKRLAIGLLILLFVAGAGVFVLVTFYKKEMAQLLIDQLKTRYALDLKVTEVKVNLFSHWPQASVELRDVQLISLNGNRKREPLLKAATISLSFNLRKLMQRQFVVRTVSLRDASLSFSRDSDGDNNFSFKRSLSDTGSSGNLQFDIHKVQIKNTRIHFVNAQKQQDIDLVLKDNLVRTRMAADGAAIDLSGGVEFRQLLFNPVRGPFLKQARAELKLRVDWFFESKMMVVYPGSTARINGHPYQLNAWLQLADSARRLALHVGTRQLNYAQGGRLLNPRIRDVMSNFAVEKPLDVDATIIARLDVKEDPVLLIKVDTKDNAIRIGHSKVPYNHVFFNGSIVSLDSSHRRGASEQAAIRFRGVRGHLYNFPFTASLSIVNFDDPHITIQAQLSIDAKKINSKLTQDFILNGKCLAGIRYSGPTRHLNRQEFLGPAMKLDASLFFTDLSYRETNKPFVYTVNGRAQIDNRDLRFDRLSLTTVAGKALLKGKADNFVNYVLGYDNKLKASITATSELLDLNYFLPARGATLQPTPVTSARQPPSSSQINSNEFDFDAVLSAKKLLIRKVEASNARVDLGYRNKLLTIRSLSVNTCGGKLSARGTIYDLAKIKAEITMQDLDISRLFTEFEDFGQKTVQSRHVQGRISLNASFKTDLDDNMEVVGKSMEGDVRLKLKDGHLLNFEPIQSVSDYVFRHRDFKDVSFSELNENFRVRGYEMEIQELEIGSNVLNLYVTGTYNFKENSNINLLIPWHNLKRRGKNYVPKTYGEGMDSARGLKLNYSGPTSNMKLRLGHNEAVASSTDTAK